MKLTSFGGAGTVTGSKHLLSHNGKHILVDCGLFQGLKNLRELNWEPLPIAPKELDAVVLTHAHLDHSGYLPRLVRDGFRGRIYATAATRDVAELILKDSGHLQEKDAEYANRKGFSKHKPALPLYTVQDAERALKQFSNVPFGKPAPLPDGATLTFRYAGHILGAATAEIDWGGKRIVFSGDLGRYDDPMLFDPQPVTEADYVVIESTYGNRTHAPSDAAEALGAVIEKTVGRGGTVVIPAFAVGRAQLLLYYLWKLRQAGRLGSVPIYLDSPMAINASELLCDHLADHRLPAEICHAACGIATYTREVEESKQITASRFPKVVISASGMATGGRVLHHLALYLGHHRNMVVLTGYQAPGTRGDSLSRGSKAIRIHGQDVPVRAEVVQLQSASAHADASQLMDWLRASPHAPHRVFVTHGDPGASDALRQRIEHELGWRALVPEHGSTWAV